MHRFSEFKGLVELLDCQNFRLQFFIEKEERDNKAILGSPGWKIDFYAVLFQQAENSKPCKLVQFYHDLVEMDFKCTEAITNQ